MVRVNAFSLQLNFGGSNPSEPWQDRRACPIYLNSAAPRLGYRALKTTPKQEWP
jgi:hypothetical protein